MLEAVFMLCLNPFGNLEGAMGDNAQKQELEELRAKQLNG